MKKSAQSKTQILFIIVLIIPILLLWFGYVYFLQPKKEELAQTQSQEKMEKKMVSVLQQKYADHQKNLGENSKALQIQVPVDPLVDQFLLQMEKAEIMSDSEITAVSISDVNQTDSNGNKAKPQPSVTGEKSSQLPDQLQKATFQLSVNSPEYSNMRQFLDIIEAQSRIATIDNISFSGPTEQVTRQERKDQSNPDGSDPNELKYQVSVTSYYAQKIKDLINDLPWIKHSEPSQKENPLYSEVPADDKKNKNK